MSLSTKEIQSVLEAISEALSETALTLEEIRLRVNMLRHIVDDQETESCVYANLTRHVLGKEYFMPQDFDF